jgi:hypothetical protein
MSLGRSSFLGMSLCIGPTVTGQAKRQSEEEQEQLLDELIRRLRLTLASCESLAAVVRPICQLAHEWACGHQLSNSQFPESPEIRCSAIPADVEPNQKLG